MFQGILFARDLEAGGLGRANTYRFVTEIRFTKLSFQTLEDCCLFASFNWRPEFIHRSIFSNKRAFIIGRDYFRLFFDKIQLDEEAMVLKFDFLIISVICLQFEIDQR